MTSQHVLQSGNAVSDENISATAMLHQLCGLYKAQGRYKEAEKVLQRTIDGDLAMHSVVMVSWP
jgi:hypothetical protein